MMLKTIVFSFIFVTINCENTWINSFLSKSSSFLEAEPLLHTCEVSINALLEQFRKMMPTGNQQLHIPVLEPYHNDMLHINITHEIGTCHGTMDDVTIINLSTFNDTEINCQIMYPLNKFKFTIRYRIPHIVMTGNYDLSGLAMDMIPLYGDGPFRIDITDLRIEVNSTVTVRIGSIKEIHELRINASIAQLKTNFENLLGGNEEYGEMFNRMFSDLGPEAIEILWPEIEPLIVNKIMSTINEQIYSMPVNIVLELFQPMKLFGLKPRT